MPYIRPLYEQSCLLVRCIDVCFGPDRHSLRSIYHSLHHVGLGVAQSFGSEEDVDHAVVTDHLQDHGAGTERPTATASVPAPYRTNTRQDRGVEK